MIAKVISEERHPAKIWATDLEAEAEQQVKNMAKLPFIFKHIAVMPDAHAGKGSTVGTVIATKGAIIPAAVGVDIGCGMSAVKLPFKIDQFEDLPKLRSSFERSIPLGFNGHKDVTEKMGEAFMACPGLSDATADEIGALRGHALKLGTLGGGNHFIELCFDENNDAWIMLHSGSRGYGNKIATVHIDRAKDLMKKYFLSETLSDPDLAYLVQDTKEFQEYINDLHSAQEYAKQNRRLMMNLVLKDISYHLFNEEKELGILERVDCHHNYTSIENHYGQNVWITRKGAVSARAGELGIIPGSMGVKSFIVEGLGNPESFCSCSHGAGRKMSRTKARASFKNEDLVEQTKGVECKKSDDVLDEIPGAYKDIDQVMANQSDLVKVRHTLKQVLCVKG